jgi:hypothetical protein
MPVICETHEHAHESADDRAARLSRLSEILRGGKRALTRADWGAVLPPRSIQGCPQNLERGRVARQLRAAGFWEANSTEDRRALAKR